MFIKDSTTKHETKDGIKEYHHFSLVCSFRSPLKGDNPTQVTVVPLGSRFDLDKKDWPIFTKRFQELLNGVVPLVPVEYDPKIEVWADKAVKKYKEIEFKRAQEALEKKRLASSSAENELVRAGDITALRAPSCGAEALALTAMKHLSIREALEEAGLSPKQVKESLFLIGARMAFPASEAATFKWGRERSSLGTTLGLDLPNSSVMALHRAADAILEVKDFLNERLFSGYRELSHGGRVYIIFDNSNTFLHGTGAGIEKAKRGRCKSKTKNPLVTVSAAVDQDGFLINPRFLEGNICESKTLEGFIKSSGVKPGDLILTDAGIATKDNLAWLDRNGYKYLVSNRSSKRDFDESLANPYKMASGGTIQAYRVVNEDSQRAILHCYSPDRALKEESMVQNGCDRIEKELRAISDGLTRPRTIKGLDAINRRVGRILQKNSVSSQYFEISVVPSEDDPTLAVRIDFSRKEVAGSKGTYPGVYALETNDLSLSEEEMVRTYFKLPTVEELFRTLKSELGLRPIYHKLGKHAEAHLYISCLAYQCVTYIRNKLKSVGIHRSWRTILESAEIMRYARMIVPTLDGQRAVLIEDATQEMGSFSPIWEACKAVTHVIAPSRGVSWYRSVSCEIRAG